ncbi:Pickpocket protein 28 [Frankliniella fusca]|uniref:Pickpocket protein 28 n=1 Tax=Frankliniella fusca TaxID=407009 RepID=A0AAE1H1F6_9NEOP|nr:Pickpocket protein 28 [Frankliniella fusca]
MGTFWRFQTRVWKREIISRLLLGARPFSQVKPGKRLFSRLYLGKNHRFQLLTWEAVGKRLFPRLRDLPTASQVLLHNPVETPKITAFGFLVEPGTENRVAITPIIGRTSPKLKSVSVEKRQCLFQHERNLQFYRTYTQRNCILECEANFTLSHCKCVAYYMPKDRLTRICGKKDEHCANVAREAMELRLANSAANLTQLNITDVPSCQCLPGCSELSYSSSHSSSHFAPTYTPEGVDEKSPRTIDYLLKNSAVIHFYFTETLFASRFKGELFGFTEFLSNSGGILGLFLGFSFLSVVEVAYFISLRIYCSWSRTKHAVRSKTKNRKKLKLEDDDKSVAIVDTIPYLQ